MFIDTLIPAALLIALAIDALLGDPRWLHRRAGHPVEWLGAVIAWWDRRFNRESDTEQGRQVAGRLFALGLLAGAAGIGWAVQAILLALPGGFVWLGLVMSTLIAQRGLHDHVKAVIDALEKGGLADGRLAVSRIVGRDPGALDEAGVARAGIESLAENFSDAVTAPLFWGLLLGLPGLLAYKALNTADSMIGHRTPRHLSFGRWAAKLDDVANFVPARLSGAILAICAHALQGAKPSAAWAAMWRDAPHHRSPNAGWPEAAMAGALGLALAGPREYHGSPVADRWMGAGGKTQATIQDIRRALGLFVRACLALALIVAAIAAIIS